MTLPRAIVRFILFALISAFVVGSQTIILPFYRGPKSYWLPVFWQWGIRKSFGIKVIVKGQPVKDCQTLYVGNHLSYFDIPVIGSLVMGSFVARGDMSRWPLFGYMGKMQQTIYISRDRNDALEGKNALEKKLKDGANLIIFAEGTSSDGSKVLPFKSSLFSLAIDSPTGKPLAVQPVTISLLEVAGQPAVTSAVRDLYAWHSDMVLWPHIWQFAKLSGAVVEVKFHPPRDAAAYKDRKTLCNDCYNDVSGGLALAA